MKLHRQRQKKNLINRNLRAKSEDIFEAAEEGDNAAVGDFINHGADVNAKDDFGHTPLHWAAKQGHQEIAELLISKGADVNAKDKDGRSPLHWAIDRDYKDVAELLRKHGAKE